MFIVPQDDEDEDGFLGRIKELMVMLGGKPIAGDESQEEEEEEEEEYNDANS